MILWKTPNQYMTWCLMKLITLVVLTSASGITSAHFEKQLVIRINRSPFTDGGLMGPITLIPHASNGHEATMRWSNSGSWCMKSEWIWQTLHHFEYCAGSAIMNGLPDQVMSRLLDGEDKSEVFFLNNVAVTFGPNQGSAEIVDGLLGTFIIFSCK